MSPFNASERTVPRPLDVTVVICAYTLERWELLQASIVSVLAQSIAPVELVVCIDHNPELFAKVQEACAAMESAIPIRVLENRYGGRLGSARTTALEVAAGTLVAFLDDDAAAEPEWLAHLLPHLGDPHVAAVGGAPHPTFENERPAWFPYEFDWVFGCVYRGLPTTASPVRHVIGAAMAARRDDLRAIGGFHSDDHDDMDMCHRLLAHAPGSEILFEPDAVVQHFVPAKRQTWSYFWRRCFFVNRGKVSAFRAMGEAGNLDAEKQFARRIFSESLLGELGAFVSGDKNAGLRAGSICVGVALAAAGYAIGTLEVIARECPLRARRRTL